MSMNHVSNRLGRVRGSSLVAAFIGILGILAAPREKAWANDIAYRETIPNTDFVSAGVGGMRNAAVASISLAGISGTVDKAYLYWGGPMNTTNAMANATIRVNGANVTGANIGLSDDNCWGFAVSQSYRADITSMVRTKRNGTYLLSDFVHQGTNVNANGASILVFFTDADPANNRDIVLFDGNDSNAPNPYDELGWNVILAGVNYSGGQAFFEAHVSDGQVYPDDDVLLNGTVIEQRGEVFQGETVPAANDGPMHRGSLWDIKRWEITSHLDPATNTLTLTHAYIGHDCVSLVVAAINLPMGAAPPPPPVNHPPELSGTPEITLNSPNAIPVTAQVIDSDADALTYRISIDGVEVKTGSIPAGEGTTTGTLSTTNGFALGSHTVVFSANDGQASGSFTTRIQVIDDTPPVLNLPPNMIVPADLGKNTALVNYVVTATDDFPGVVVVSLPVSGSEFPIGITTVTATAVDSSGNRTQGTFTITVTDSTPPSIHCPADLLQRTDPGASNAVVHYSIPAADNMPGMSLNCSPASGSAFSIGITTIVCMAQDVAGNTATCMFTVTVMDQEPPVVTVSTNIVTVSDLNQCEAIVHYEASVRDNAPGAALVCEPPSGAAFPLGVTSVRCIGTDAAGNKATNSFTVTVEDKESPAFAPLPALTVPTDPGRATAVVQFNVAAGDNCSSVSIVCTPASGSVFALGTTPVTCTATDGAGNTATAGFPVNVVDREPPVVTVPNPITVPTDPGQYSAVVTFLVSVQDNVPGATVVVTPLSGSTFPVGTTTVVAVGTDAAGNQATNQFTVTVVDNEKPVLNLPADLVITVPAGVNNAVVQYTVTANDNGPTVTVVSTPASGSTFPLGTTTVTAQATDGSGNVTTGSFTVTVVQENNPDTQPPVISAPPNLIVPADLAQCAALVTFSVTATDDQPGPVVVVCTPPSGSTFPVGTTPVICVATDAAGNKATNQFIVTVEDRQNPALQLPANLSVSTDPGQSTAHVSFNVTATDNCSAVTVLCAPASGSVFPLGATPVDCTATDSAGNSASGVFTVTVVDTEPPVVTVPGPITVGTDPGQNSAVVNFIVTIQDNVPGATLVVTPPTGSTFPVGTTTVVAVGTDAAGNTATNSFTVTVLDNEKPVLDLPDDIVVVVPVGVTNAVVEFIVTATDNSQTVTVVTTPDSGSTFPLGTNTVTVTATDGAGNVTTGSFTVTVVQEQESDTQPPVITTPGNLLRVTDLGQCSAIVTYEVSVTDNNPGAAVTCSPPSGSSFPKGVTPVVCQAADTAGNKATNSFTVTIEDRENPTLNLPANLSVPTDPGQNSAVVQFAVTATDNCSGVTVVCSPASGSSFALGTMPVACTATDSSGNSVSGQFTVTVVDNEKPVLNLPANIVITVSTGVSNAVVEFTVTATDNSQTVTVVTTPDSGSTFPLGTNTVTVTATDGSGNVTTGTFTVVVLQEQGSGGEGDSQPPVITTPGNLLRVTDLGQCSAVVTFEVSVADNNPGATVSCVPASGSTFLKGVTPVVCQAADTAGNKATNSFTVTVEDRENPTLNLPANLSVFNDPGQNSAAVQFTVTATDNCSGATVVCSPASGSSFPLGTMPVACTATDSSGNSVSGQFTVTVVDNEKPVLNLPAAIVVTVPTGISNAMVEFTVTATDNSGTVTVVTTPVSGSSFPLGTNTVTVTATDGSGNVTTGTFTVTVVQEQGGGGEGDSQPPVITTPGNLLRVTDLGQCSAVVTFEVSVADNNLGATVSCVPASGSTFPKGVTPVVCQAADTAGNKATNSFTVTVEDRENPTLNLPANLSVPNDPGQSSAVVQFTVTATDNCSGATVVCSPASGSSFPLGTMPVACTATDSSGNSVSGQFTVTVVDNEKPVLNLPAAIVVTVPTGISNAVVEFTVTATDNSGTVTVVSTPVSGSSFPLGINTVTATATDGSGNVTTGTFTVTVLQEQGGGGEGDSQPPVITTPGNLLRVADLGQCSAAVTFDVSVADNNPGATVNCVPASGSTFPRGATPVVCNATDLAGNKATNTFTVTVVDREKPALQLPGDLTVAVDDSQGGAIVTYVVTATDNCSTPVLVCEPASGSVFSVGATPVHCTATDEDANTTTGSFRVLVTPRPIADPPPVINGSTNRVVATDLSQCAAVVDYTVTVLDNQPGATLVCLPPSGSTFPKGATPVVCVATDAASNQTTNTFTVTVVDQENPTLQLPANKTVTIPTNATTALVEFSVTATDNCSVPTVVCTPASGSSFPLGTTPVTCTATDGDGNVATGTFTVTVQREAGDTQPPVINGSTNRIVATDLNQCAAVVDYTVTVIDNQPGATLVCLPPSGSTFPKGATPVVCVATDAASNQTTTTFTVTVVDQENPALQLPANKTVTIPTNATTAVVEFIVTATDNCSIPTVVCTPASGSSFPLGTTPVTCTATDADGNVGTGTFTVTVQREAGDTQPPVINGSTNRIVATDLSQCAAIVDYTVTVLDNQPGTTLVCLPPSGSTFSKGTTPVVCVATDAASNQTTSTFTVTVVDQENPTLQLPANMTVTIPTNATTALVEFSVTATDNCSVPTVVCTPASGSSFPLGTTPVTCTATDEDGNVGTGTFTVTVQREAGDSRPPDVSIRPSKGLLWPPNHKMVPIRLMVSATDDSGQPVVSRIVSVTSNEPLNGLADGNTGSDWIITGALTLQLHAERSGLGTGRIYTITVESTDAAGNVTTSTVNVLVPHDLSRKAVRPPKRKR